jgi:hypothetical protein
VAVAGVLLLAACGNTPGERAASGAVIGAGGGAAVGAMTDVGVLNGALLGGAAGALTGAVTSRDQVNLGKPVWKKNHRRNDDD